MLGDVVHRTLAASVPDDPTGRINAKGPHIRLEPNTAVSLGMTFHEPAADALKYGALSTSCGRVEVCWRVAVDNSAFLLDWREAGGPPVTPPNHRGVGSRLIERGLVRETPIGERKRELMGSAARYRPHRGSAGRKRLIGLGL